MRREAKRREGRSGTCVVVLRGVVVQCYDGGDERREEREDEK